MKKGVYSDIHHALKRNDKGDTTILIDHDVVQSAVENVWGTIEGERVFNRIFGSKLEEVLFEQLDLHTLIKVQTECIAALSRSREERVNMKINAGLDRDEQTILINTVFSAVDLERQIGEFTTELVSD